MRQPKFLFSMMSAAFLAVAVLGCGGGDEIVHPEVPQNTEGAHVHEHPSHGPHEGHLIELGAEEYHAELLHDEENHKVTIYILDGAAKEAVTIEAAEILINVAADGEAKQFKLAAAPQESDPEGKSSRFELVDEELLHELEEEGNKLKLSLTINEKPYTGDIELGEHEHDHEHEEGDHDHDKEDQDHEDEEGHDDDKSTPPQ